MIEIDKKLDLWCEDVYKSIRKNFEVQHIYPTEVYPGYNEKNAKSGGWKSTGAAYDKIYWNVFTAANGDSARIDYFFKYYLYFVDMGVGKGHKLSQVDNASPASNQVRYKNWSGPGDRQSRPVVSMEFNYQISRLFRYVVAKYDEDAVMKIVHSLSDDKE